MLEAEEELFGALDSFIFKIFSLSNQWGAARASNSTLEDAVGAVEVWGGNEGGHPCAVLLSIILTHFFVMLICYWPKWPDDAPNGGALPCSTDISLVRWLFLSTAVLYSPHPILYDQLAMKKGRFILLKLNFILARSEFIFAPSALVLACCSSSPEALWGRWTWM